MFGFQPTPISPELIILPSSYPPPPPPPPYPCPSHNCDITLYWDNVPTGIDILYTNNFGFFPIMLVDYVYTYDPIYVNGKSICLEFSIENWYQVPLFHTISSTWWGLNTQVGCANGGEYNAVIGVRPKLCPGYTPVTVNTVFKYYCEAAQWTVDPITVNGSVGTINVDLKNYVYKKSCQQNYYYNGDDGGGSQSINNGVITTSFSSPGNYVGSATVANNCQDVSANTVGIYYTIT
jgi:hypothetical protein